MSSDSVKKRSRSSWAALRLMKTPIWRPTAANRSSRASSGSWVCRLKNSITPRRVVPTVIGNPIAERRPSRAAIARAREVRVAQHVGDPRRRAAGPHAAGQPLAGTERAIAAVAGKRLERLGRRPTRWPCTAAPPRACPRPTGRRTPTPAPGPPHSGSGAPPRRSSPNRPAPGPFRTAPATGARPTNATRTGAGKGWPRRRL